MLQLTPTHYAQRPRCAPGSSPPDGSPQAHLGPWTVEEISSLHHQVKENLEKSTEKYKAAVDVYRREVQFNVGDLV
ncbi:unnamed protein product [Microthlaspi erraticum]|uniref:Uncharacterized protein n=1 Tax=Microthlaspi erraticum TaxID=1685480 RepID=A0A6D2IUQ1_9BRAS|nr:unnamed protein product [Microthlaspi erraticum]